MINHHEAVISLTVIVRVDRRAYTMYKGVIMVSEVAQKIERYFSKFPKRSYPKGQILIFADENPDYIYYIVKGKVRKYDVSYRGDEVIVNIFKSPAFFPMAWAINRTPNKYFYKTETDTELHAVPIDDAVQFLKDNQDVTFDLLSRVYRGMDGLLNRMVGLMSGTARSRLLYELVVESRRFGTKNNDGSYTLDVHEVDLAARAGLSRETVSREMRKIITEGLVSNTANRIVIKDLKSLENKISADI